MVDGKWGFCVIAADVTVGDGGVLERSTMAVEGCDFGLSKLVASRRTWCCRVVRV